MLNRSHFVSKRNYYIIYIFDKVLWLIYKLCKLLDLIALGSTVTNRVIFLEYAHLGDALLLTPAIRLAKGNRKKLEIICFVSESGAEALENNPLISRIVIIDLPWFSDHIGIIHSIKTFLKLIKLIRSIKAEVVINFRSTRYHVEHIAMWAAGVPRRIGYSHKGFEYLLTDYISDNQRGLIAQQKVNLVEKWLGIPSRSLSLRPDFYIKDEEKIIGKEIFEKLSIDKSKKIIGINASTQHNFLWPEDHYVALCSALLKDKNCELIFLGTSNFISAYDRINEWLPIHIKSLAGKTTLDELAAALEQIDLLITVDTGMRHLANAIGTPVIALKHGANNVHEYGKYVKSEEVLFNEVSCSPCGKELCPLGTTVCMTGIMPEIVLSQTRRYWANE